MNPQSSEAPGLNLPPPVSSERAPAPTSAPGPSTPEQFEQAPLQTQKDPTRVQPTVPTIPLPPTPMAHTPPVDNATMTTSTTDTPLIADDGDLIEKEWVNKAKAIVERTRENPYQQSKELNLFKADYMKKRYNKTLKLSE
jgi:hypothetical protein